MNENLNLVEILKDCPSGTKLYSPLFGEVEFQKVTAGVESPITVRLKCGNIYSFTLAGRIFTSYEGECMLFPSKEQRDWSKFKAKQPKFDPKTLQPFDKVLVRDGDEDLWTCVLFSNYTAEAYPFICGNASYMRCIPYNDDTKHLVGRNEEAPEYYRYWED